MSTAKIAAALLLVGGAYVVWQRSNGEMDFSPVDVLGDAADSVTEAIGAYSGVEMNSGRYQRALENPENAGIIAVLGAAEQRYGIPSGLLVRQAWQESRFNPAAVSPVGARGLMQFMPATAKEWGVDVASPESSADGAGRYMAWLYSKTGSWSLALAAYNWGIGNVLRKGLTAAPKETRDYVAQIGADTGVA